MAIRGTKPTATILKLAAGNPGKRPLPHAEPIATGRPIKPPRLGKRAEELWDRVAVYEWLTEAESGKLHIWCELQAEFERSPRTMTAARIGQLRAAGSELGLDPSSRARLGTDAAKTLSSKYFS